MDTPDQQHPTYRLRADAAPQRTTADVGRLAQGAGLASAWIRKGLADRVGIHDRERLVLTITRVDVRLLDDPGPHDAYEVVSKDLHHTITARAGAPHLRDALVLADDRLAAPAVDTVDIRRGHTAVARLTRADAGRLWPAPAP